MGLRCVAGVGKLDRSSIFFQTVEPFSRAPPNILYSINFRPERKLLFSTSIPTSSHSWLTLFSCRQENGTVMPRAVQWNSMENRETTRKKKRCE